MPVFLALGRLIQEYRELKTGLSYIVILFHTTNVNQGKETKQSLQHFPDTWIFLIIPWHSENQQHNIFQAYEESDYSIDY